MITPFVPVTDSIRIAAIDSGGVVGDAAKAVAELLHPHFVKEEAYALPPLGLLALLAKDEVRPEMAAVLAMTDQLRSELPNMLSEHARKRQHLRVILRQGSAVRIRQRSRDERTAIQREMIAIAGEGDCAQICARDLEAVFRQLKLAADARVQQI